MSEATSATSATSASGRGHGIVKEGFRKGSAEHDPLKEKGVRGLRFVGGSFKGGRLISATTSAKILPPAPRRTPLVGPEEPLAKRRGSPALGGSWRDGMRCARVPSCQEPTSKTGERSWREGEK